jgi:hypothetical protein
MPADPAATRSAVQPPWSQGLPLKHRPARTAPRRPPHLVNDRHGQRCRHPARRSAPCAAGPAAAAAAARPVGRRALRRRRTARQGRAAARPLPPPPAARGAGRRRARGHIRHLHSARRVPRRICSPACRQPGSLRARPWAVGRSARVCGGRRERAGQHQPALLTGHQAARHAVRSQAIGNLAQKATRRTRPKRTREAWVGDVCVGGKAACAEGVRCTGCPRIPRKPGGAAGRSRRRWWRL